MKFKEYKRLDLTGIAEGILKFWEADQIFEKSISSREGARPYIFYEGPPSANGMPGIHHLMARTVKDLFCRYHTLKGEQVRRKAGWDTHGLPVELGVERALGITKEAIGAQISVQDYNEACRKAVMRYTAAWREMTRKMGYWVDMEHPYVTYTSKYMETLWWLIKRLDERDLLYKGYTVQPYSPAAGTGLSSHELNMPGAYREVSDTTVVAQFKALTDTLPKSLQAHGTVFLLAWTTTPWTLPSNTALTVGKALDYALVETFNRYTQHPIKVVLAEALVPKQFGSPYYKSDSQADFDAFSAGDKKIPYRILATFKGAELVGTRFEQLLPWALPYQAADQAFRVIEGDFVTVEEGTGIVHTAPTFGADDAHVARAHGVPPLLVLDAEGKPVPLVDLQGRFIDQLPAAYRGKYVKNAYYPDGSAPQQSVDVEICIDLKARNRAFKVEKYKHPYPHCWRTDKPVLYYPLHAWFIRSTQCREAMIRLNKTINWKPSSTGTGRFGNWLEHLNDWNLSRSRYWGTPLPIWCTEKGDERLVIGSLEELMRAIDRSLAAGLMKKNPYEGFVVGDYTAANYEKVDLHKPFVDEIVLVSSKGEPMYRESDLIDVWFDSGAMPYAQWHYPFEHRQKIDEGRDFPADFIAEGVDQTRGWFFTLHAIGVMAFDSVAYKNVVSNGLVLDKNGQKMSKRLGNAVDPFETLAAFGPDATRWYMVSNAQPWENLRFDTEGIEAVKRKFFGTLYNTYAFFALYANVDGFDYAEAEVPPSSRPELDRWLLSELNTLVGHVDAFYADYEPMRAARAIADFTVDHLSNWYVRLSRRRFWKGHYSQDKIAAYQTLYTALITLAKLASPIAPFFMDRLYKDLNQVARKEPFESVNLARFPQVHTDLIDEALEAQTELAQNLCSLVLSLRKKEGIKVRQPLQRVLIPALNPSIKARIQAVSDLVRREVNVKAVVIPSDEQADAILLKSIKPNFKVLGPRYGKAMGGVAKAIAALSKADIRKMECDGQLELVVGGTPLTLRREEVEISTRDIEGWLVATQNGLTVALDITLTDNLKHEGLARDLVNRVQHLRKEHSLEVVDKIRLILQRTPLLEVAVHQNKEYICGETLTTDLVFVDTLKGGVRLAIDDLELKARIEKV